MMERVSVVTPVSTWGPRAVALVEREVRSFGAVLDRVYLKGLRSGSSRVVVVAVKVRDMRLAPGKWECLALTEPVRVGGFRFFAIDEDGLKRVWREQEMLPEGNPRFALYSPAEGYYAVALYQSHLVAGDQAWGKGFFVVWRLEP